MKGKKFDQGKTRWELVHWKAAEEEAEVLTHGAKKYDDNNWIKVLQGEGGKARYFAAALRHIFAWWRGETHDPESGLHHLANARCCLMFLMYGEV